MRHGPIESYVVDASVAAKWHLTDEEHTEQARSLLPRFAQGQLELWAPEQIRYEVPSAITAATLGRRPRITQEQGREAIEEFLSLVSLGLQTVASEELILGAYPLVHRHGCAYYDALYLALARSLDIPLLTADGKFYQRFRDLPKVVWIGDLQP